MLKIHFKFVEIYFYSCNYGPKRDHVTKIFPYIISQPFFGLILQLSITILIFKVKVKKNSDSN